MDNKYRISDPKSAAMQELLFYVTGGLCEVLCQCRAEGKKTPGEADRLVTENLYLTGSNICYDEEYLRERITLTIAIRDEVLQDVQVRLLLSDAVTWQPEDPAEYADKAEEVLASQNPDEDERSAREIVIYGLKGLASYTYHADIAGGGDRRLAEFLERMMAMLNDDQISGGQLISCAMEVGNYGMLAMSTLNKANTDAYGEPTATKVDLGVGTNPGILVSGNDLRDLEMLLKQTQGTGVDVYTHGEMLAAHGYPELKKYPNLKGNYGGAWQQQTADFASFHGPILMTASGLVPPEDSYKDRLYTTGLVHYPGVRHIDGAYGEPRDFSALIQQAKQCAAPTELENGTVTTGYGFQQIFEIFDQLEAAVKAGKIKKFVVMAGSDGPEDAREYYTEFAKVLPKDTVILTAGSAKYRYNKLDLGEIDGIPRLLDAGQSNDSYALIMTALKLQEALNAPDINHVPVVYNMAWYEPKDVMVILTMLSLDVRRIHIGPTVPSFTTEVIRGLFVSNFKMGTITEDVQADAEKLLSDEKDPISRTTIIGDLLKEYPAAGDILISLGLGCVGCGSALTESIEQASVVHKLNPRTILEGLKEGLGGVPVDIS